MISNVRYLTTAWTLAGAIVLSLAASAQQKNQSLDPLSFRAPSAQPVFDDIEIEQKLGATVPLNLAFRNEAGELVQLKDLVDGKPVVLSLVYYECPSLCTQILNGLGQVLGAVDHTIGEDFTVITATIDPGESTNLAAEKKAQYLAEYGREGSEEGWHFLTGDEVSIETLATAVGFRYFYDAATDQYAHASGIMVLTPEGVVSRYFYGTEYLPRDLSFALVEASDGKVGSPVEKFVLLCFLYDPATGKYGFYIIGAMRLLAVAILIALCVFWAAHYVSNRKKPQHPELTAAQERDDESSRRAHLGNKGSVETS